jgi:uncharacterized protein (DUF1015 family)
MAIVLPFRGLTYNPEKIGDLSAVTTPPYDVISPEAQEEAYARHPRNIIRLILGRIADTDTEADNRYTRAAAHFAQWRDEGTLVRDPEPAYYLCATDFEVDGAAPTRWGIVARVGLEPFDRGVVLPHERTFSKVKSDRLALMKTCRANFGPIFSLFPGGTELLRDLQAAVSDRPAEMDFTDGEGHRQRLWRLTEPGMRERIRAALEPRPLFIADGHHRYETALAYRDGFVEEHPDTPPDHPVNFVLMYLAAMDDPGMVIRPAHRLLKAVGRDVADDMLRRARDFFEVAEYPWTGADRSEVQARFFAGLGENPDRTSIGFLDANRSAFHLLRIRPGVMADRYGEELSAALRDLDVTVLTRLIFMDLMGFDHARLDDERLIGYASVAAEAAKAVAEGPYDAAFFLNPTRIEQVQRVAREREIMPRKSTYFYPKVITGQVIHSLTD